MIYDLQELPFVDMDWLRGIADDFKGPNGSAGFTTQPLVMSSQWLQRLDDICGRFEFGIHHKLTIADFCTLRHTPKAPSTSPSAMSRTAAECMQLQPQGCASNRPDQFDCCREFLHVFNRMMIMIHNDHIVDDVHDDHDHHGGCGSGDGDGGGGGNDASLADMASDESH